MKKLNENQVNEVLQGKTIVDFYADWCGPCQYMKPFFEDAEKDLTEMGYTCYEINVDECDAFAGQNRIQFIPCVILFDNGKEVARFTGGRDKQGILEFVKQNA